MFAETGKLNKDNEEVAVIIPRAISFSTVSFYVFTKVGDFNCQVI